MRITAIKVVCTQGVNIHLYEDVKNIISELRSRHTGYTDFPMELKRQVYSIICKQLASKDNTYTQTQLLEYLGLPKDVFKEKYWNMYSPDMKLRQQVYHNLHIPLNYAEVECNEIYRGMLHYIISQADQRTDTFFDMFGKMGLVPLFCANGYSNRIVLLARRNYHQLVQFQNALKKPVKVYKHIKAFTKTIEVMGIEKQKEVLISKINQWLALFSVYQDWSATGYDEYTLAARYFMCNCLRTEYWLDSKLEKTYSYKDGKLVVGDVFLETTLKNIQSNGGKIAISVYNGETLEGYQIKGTATYVTEGTVVDTFKAMVEKMFNGAATAKGALIINPEKVIVTTPGADNKKEI